MCWYASSILQRRGRGTCSCILSAVCFLVMPVAYPQLAVIDSASVSQLVTQAGMLQEQLATAQGQLARADEQLRALQGARGMEQLLSGTLRNYLPSQWSQLQQLILAREPAYAALSRELVSLLDANMILPETYLVKFSPQARGHIQATRQHAAMLQVLSHEALAVSSSRFDSIQRLIDAIPEALDPKAIMDLQACIGAEQSMLQNEENKLQALYQSMHAQERVDHQQLQENLIAGHGRFDSRFQPQPNFLHGP